MNRSKYLALLEGVGLAGCTGRVTEFQGATATEPSKMRPQNQAGDTATESDTPTPTEQGRVTLNAETPELITIDRSYGEYPGARSGAQTRGRPH